MTAKKYVENATSDRLVVFQRDIFKDFVNQLCKEQRELCWEDMKGFDYEVSEDRNVAKNIILNAKQPEI